MAKIGSKTLTKYLKQIAEELSDEVRDDGTLVTNAEKLARVIWKKACGYTEMQELRDGTQVEKIYRPDNTAIMLILDRMEGKVASAEPEDSDRLTVEENISELAKKRLNAFVAETVASAPKPPPPIGKKRGASE